MITYRATLDLPASTVSQVARWLSGYRKLHDRRPWQRAATPFVQAVMVLRWFKNATDLPTLAHDGRVSIATAYRYVHEAIDVIAAHAPDLPEVLAHGLQQGWTFCCLDGTLIPSVRSAAPSEAGHDVWHSGKHHRHGGNIQVLTGPTGYPEWVSDVEPGSTHDITAARIHALPALYPAAAAGVIHETLGVIHAPVTDWQWHGIEAPSRSMSAPAGLRHGDGVGTREPDRVQLEHGPPIRDHRSLDPIRLRVSHRTTSPTASSRPSAAGPRQNQSRCNRSLTDSRPGTRNCPPPRSTHPSKRSTRNTPARRSATSSPSSSIAPCATRCATAATEVTDSQRGSSGPGRSCADRNPTELRSRARDAGLRRP